MTRNPDSPLIAVQGLDLEGNEEPLPRTLKYT